MLLEVAQDENPDLNLGSGIPQSSIPSRLHLERGYRTRTCVRHAGLHGPGDGPFLGLSRAQRP